MATCGINVSQNELVLLLLDSGAQHSFIREATASRLGLRFEDPQSFTTRSFGGHTTTEVSYSVTLVVLRDQSGAPMRLTLRTRRVTTSIRADTHISRDTAELLRLSRAHNHSMSDRDVDVDILIGIEYYWEIVDPTIARRLSSGLTLIHTRFGPVASGSNLQTCVKDEEIEPDISRLWDLEFMGITDSMSPRQDEQMLLTNVFRRGLLIE
ncbi:hypothetical protein OSTOST_02605 [Ostertagia ostertagi]